MPSAWTNRGKFQVFKFLFHATSIPTNYFGALISDAVANVTPAVNTKSDLNELANGNGYTTGGISLNKNTTDFPIVSEDDTNNRAIARIRDLTWTASGGNLGPATFLILTDDNSTQGNRVVFCYFDFNTSVTVSPGQTLTVQSAEMRAL